MDLLERGELKTSSATAAGTAWLSIVIIFPFGLPAATEDVACNRQGIKIATILADRDGGKVQ